MNRRGQMIPRGDNKWLLRVYVGRDGNGKRKYVGETIEGTTHQARQALTKMLRQNDTHTLAAPVKITLAEYVEEWYKSKVQISESTLNGYKLHLKLYIIPALGHLKLHQITPPVVQAAYNALIAQKLSPRTIEYAHTVLHQALGKAIKLGYLVRNPTEDTERPAKVEREFTILSPDQMVTLFKSEAKKRLLPLWLMLLDTGLRPGEALALKWGDLEGDLVRVQRVLVRTTKSAYKLIERKAKTQKSLRPVTLSKSMIEALKEHRLQQAKEILAYGPHYIRNDFIFASRIGSFLDPNNVRNRFKSALTRAGLPENVRLYDTRHSHATALLNEGNVNLAWVSARLGHSSTRVTEAIYAKVMPEAHRQMADTFEGIMDTARKKAASR
jgi:integrase